MVDPPGNARYLELSTAEAFTVMRHIGTWTLATTFVAATVYLAMGSDDVVLNPSQTASMFGGQATANGECCSVNSNCQDPTPVCSEDTNLQRCVQTPHPRIDPAYAWKCIKKNPACPTCDCSHWLRDSNGNTYYCIRYIRCKIVNQTCQPDVYTGTNVQGYYNCADNCAPES